MKNVLPIYTIIGHYIRKFFENSVVSVVHIYKLIGVYNFMATRIICQLTSFASASNDFGTAGHQEETKRGWLQKLRVSKLQQIQYTI